MFSSISVLFLLACKDDPAPDSGGDDSGACAEPTPWFVDGDGDGFGSADALPAACEAPAGASASADDCDDARADVNPGAAETWYDGVDADCSGGSDYDQDGDTHEDSSAGGDDCDDTRADAYPGAEEVWYDGVDQDCAGDSDSDRDGDGHDAEVVGGDDCDDNEADSWPGNIEVWYDGLDQDCSGGSDYDQDGDLHDDPVAGGDDCDDEAASVHPDAPDLFCNGLDEDCDGATDDEGLSLQGGADWVSSASLEEGWTDVGFDDSAWTAVTAPAVDDCGWTFTEANLGRALQPWEHAGTPTMWDSSAATHVYFRRTFVVPEGAVVTLASLTSIVDDEHTVYLNGVQVGRDAEPEGVPIVESDLRSALLPGTNVLAIDAEDLGGCRWALADGEVSCAP